MHLVGHVDTLPIQVFVDSCADLNFLNPSLATRLDLRINSSCIEPIVVANGRLCYTKGIAYNVSVNLQGYKFTSDVRLLSIVECDLVLEAEWLETLGYIGWHFKDKVMEFQINGTNYRLEVQPTPMTLTFLLDSYSDLFVTPTSLPLRREIDHRITLLPSTLPVNVRPYHYSLKSFFVPCLIGLQGRQNLAFLCGLPGSKSGDY